MKLLKRRGHKGWLYHTEDDRNILYVADVLDNRVVDPEKILEGMIAAEVRDVNLGIDEDTGRGEALIDGRVFALPKKKPIDVAWVMGKAGARAEFVNLSERVAPLLGEGAHVYPASYGIGVVSPMAYNFSFEKDRDAIRSILDGAGVTYREEFSLGHYVLRFIISKARENLEKLAAAERIAA